MTDIRKALESLDHLEGGQEEKEAKAASRREKRASLLADPENAAIYLFEIPKHTEVQEIRTQLAVSAKTERENILFIELAPKTGAISRNGMAIVKGHALAKTLLQTPVEIRGALMSFKIRIEAEPPPPPTPPPPKEDW